MIAGFLLACLLVTGCTSANSASETSLATSVVQAPRKLPVPAFDPQRPRRVKGSAETTFLKAMSDYAKGKYGPASVTLRDVTMADPESVEARFYLGICYLMTNDNEAGVAELKTTAALGASPYFEDAHYYLAEAFVRKKDVVNASRELDQIITMQGTRAEAARSLREVLAIR